MRFIALLLAFILGFVSCIGAIVGTVYYAYDNVTYDKLEQWKFIPEGTLDGYVDRDAEKPYTSMSISDVYKEIVSFSGASDEVTLRALTEKYGLVLPEDAEKFIPDSVMSLPVAKIFSGEGFDYILDNTTLDYIFGFLPEDLLSEPAKEALEGKSIRKIIEFDLENLLSDVKIGYLLGVSYHFDEASASYVLDYEDTENPTLFELIAPLDLGSLISSFGDSNDLLGVFRTQIGDALLLQFASALGFGDMQIVNGVLGKGQTVADLLYVEEDGSITLDLYGMVNDRYIGDLLGYTPVMLKGDGSADDIIIGWMNGEEKVTGVMLGLSRGYLEGLGTDDFDSYSLLEEAYFGDLLDYAPVYDESGAIIAWQDADGNEPDGMYRKIASHKLTEAIGEDGDFRNILNGMFVGDMLGYHTDDDGKWLDADGNPVSGVNAVVAEIDVGRLTDPDDDYDLNGVLSSHQIGEMLNWSKDGDKWVDTDGNDVTGIMVSFADLTIDEMSDSDKVTETINGLKIADVMGYTEESGVYYHGGAEVDGIMAVLAPMTVGELDNEEGGLNSIQIGKILGWTYNETEARWDKKDGTPSSGIMATFADLTVKDMSDDEKVNEKINGLKIADVMGYTEETDGSYTKNGDKVTGILAVLAPMTVSQLDDDENGLNSIKIGAIMGWTYDDVNGCWMTAENEQASGIMLSFAGLTVGEMSQNDKVQAAVDTLVIGEAMGYHKNPVDGKWYRDAAYTDELTGILASLSDTTIGELGGKIDDLTLRDAFSEAELSSGFLSLLDPDTKITHLGSAATDAYSAATIQDLMDAGLLSFGISQQASLDYVFSPNDWREYSIQGFIDALIARATMIP